MLGDIAPLAHTRHPIRSSPPAEQLLGLVGCHLLPIELNDKKDSLVDIFSLLSLALTLAASSRGQLRLQNVIPLPPDHTRLRGTAQDQYEYQ